MVKLYFIGGESISSGKSIAFKKIFSISGEPNSILVFPWTSDNDEKEKKYRKFLPSYFSGDTKIIFAELEESYESIVCKMNASDMIFLPGGSQELLLQRIKNKKLILAFQKYNKPIVGNSAGALVMCKKYVILKHQDYSLKSEFLEGMNLANISVSVHYLSKNPKFYHKSNDSDLKKLSKTRKIYAIPEQSVLVYNDGNISSLSDIYIFDDEKKIQLY